MNWRKQRLDVESPRGFCLTEMSLVTLLAGALGLSMLLWLMIAAVL